MNRRFFIKRTAAGAAAFTVGNSFKMSAKSYNRIIGVNERINVAIVGLGRMLGAYYEPIAMKENK